MRKKSGVIKALMLDVDGVLVQGRPEDGRHWSTSLEADLGLRPGDLQSEFFDSHWEEVVVGRAELAERLALVLAKLAPNLSADKLIAYWFAHDARLHQELLGELGAIRSAGVAVYLATNQEHLRTHYLMEQLGLAAHVDGIHYSAQLGARKPYRDFFDRIVARSGFAAQELLLVDDAADNIQAAAAAGWRTLHWTKAATPAAIQNAIKNTNP